MARGFHLVYRSVASKDPREPQHSILEAQLPRRGRSVAKAAIAFSLPHTTSLNTMKPCLLACLGLLSEGDQARHRFEVCFQIQD